MAPCGGGEGATSTPHDQPIDGAGVDHRTERARGIGKLVGAKLAHAGEIDRCQGCCERQRYLFSLSLSFFSFFLSFLWYRRTSAPLRREER